MPRRPQNKLVSFAKISDDQTACIVRGFACAETIAEISEASGVSEKTCRSIVLALRPRLLKLSFDIWRQAQMWHTILDPDLEDASQAAVFGCFAKCYFERRCYDAYRRGRRKSRECRKCSLHTLELGDDYLQAALYHVDLVHRFYAVLGIGGERGMGKLTLFRLRLAHTHVVGTAFEETRKLVDGSLDFEDNRQMSARDLYTKLMRDLRQDPLIRNQPPTQTQDAETEDLTWLDETA